MKGQQPFGLLLTGTVHCGHGDHDTNIEEEKCHEGNDSAYEVSIVTKERMNNVEG